MADTTDDLLRVDSPLGRLEITSDGAAVTSLTIECDGALPADERPERSNPILEEARRQLEEYFAGERHRFELPLSPAGTEFQSRVWEALQGIGWGENTTYGDLGERIGRPGSARAIGAAVGANPLPILIGCHRVVAADGRLTGYSGGDGLPTKRWLLHHEGSTLAA